jgi:hypothetical protein
VEPAGLGFVYSLLFFVLALIIQDKTLPRNKLIRWIEWVTLSFIAFVILVVGTRGALLNLIYTLAVLWFMQRTFRQNRLIRIKARYAILIIILAAFGAYLILPRVILTPRSSPLPPWIQPTYIRIGGEQIQVIGSTADYVKHTRASLHDFLTEPLGVGPLNATPIRDEPLGGFGAGYSYSWYTNLIVVGSTFGWVSLAIWLLFIVLITRDVFSLKRSARGNSLFAIAIVFLAVLIASLLPGSPFLGPSLNWSNFERYLPLSPHVKGLPFEYPSIFSGIVIGCLIGLTQKIRRNSLIQVPARVLDSDRIPGKIQGKSEI